MTHGIGGKEYIQTRCSCSNFIVRKDRNKYQKEEKYLHEWDFSLKSGKDELRRWLRCGRQSVCLSVGQEDEDDHPDEDEECLEHEKSPHKSQHNILS